MLRSIKTVIRRTTMVLLLATAPSLRAQGNSEITFLSPLDYYVAQRTSKKKGTVAVGGRFTNVPVKGLNIEARIVAGDRPGKWQRTRINLEERRFEARLNAPAGGWHRLEVRARVGSEVLAEGIVEHVGIGEVFVIAGQSNSANHGEERQNTTTGLVASFDGKRWRLSKDPQPGASGDGGSFLPPFGDAMVEKFRVPVGIGACGVGATSVREWLPQGVRFPNPPTLTGNVQPVPVGEWESKGTLFDRFTARAKQLGRHGFRAVLWHQGERDANQADETRTLRGDLYRDYLEQLIRATRRELGWDGPWFVAQASYHTPDDEGSPEIRAAQASLWKVGLALEGPDTDALKGSLRDTGGKGVHFSGAGLREHAAHWVEKVAPWLSGELR